MAISNLTGIGKNNLYVVSISTRIQNIPCRFSFYTTKKITSRNELIEFLRGKKQYRIDVTGGTKIINSTDFIIPNSLSCDGAYDVISVSYLQYGNTIESKIDNITDLVFSNSEV